MTTDNETPTTPPVEAPVRKGPFGRPPKVKVEESAKNEPTLDERAMRVMVARGRRTMMNPKQLQTAMQRRKEYLVATLEAITDGKDHRPKDMVKQYQFELKLIMAGQWTPGAKVPRGKDAQIAEAILGAPGMARSPQDLRQESRVDALLES